MKTLIILLYILTLVMSDLYAATYYIDYDNGSDSNNGLTTLTAWQHCPGMQTVSGLAAECNPQPGDTFIFKGGVIWPFTDSDPMFPVKTDNWASGSGSEPIVFSTDESWFNGSEFTRPIFDGGADKNNDGAYDGDLAANTFFNIWYADFISVEGFEMLHLGVSGYGHGSISFYQSDNSKAYNCLIHDWIVTGDIDHKFGGIIINTCEFPLIDSCTICGIVTDENEGSGIGIYGGGTNAIVRNCHIYNTSNGYLGAAQLYNNHIHHIKNSIDPTVHENGVYLFGQPGDTIQFYNNKLHNVEAGVALFLVRWTQDSGDCTFIIYNNILFDNVPINITVDNRGAQTEQESNYLIFNNTLKSYNSSITSLGPSVKNFDVRNNIFITTGTYTGVLDYKSGAQNINIDYNIYYDSLNSGIVLVHPELGRISFEESQSEGYNLNSIQTYDPIDYNDIPQSASDIGVDAGADISAIFSFDKFNISRPQGDEWDIGPYEYFEGMFSIDSSIPFFYEPLKIFPNPTKGIINIVQEDFEQLQLFDMVGNLVLTTNEKLIDIRTFPKGIYIVKIFSKDRKSTAREIIFY
ncbi:MAG: T9SS type A sorting domain-containing protein [Bacteroidales bacterium]|nr:T9SS type A sorting domain-containing protein [Bacteroidales bacterium]